MQTLASYPNAQVADLHFGQDALLWVKSWESAFDTMPAYVLKTLRNECLDAQWTDGVIALQNHTQLHPQFYNLWTGGLDRMHDSILLACVLSDNFKAFEYYLPQSSFDLCINLFLGLAKNASGTRRNFSTMLEKMAQSITASEEFPRWLGEDKSRLFLENALTDAQSIALWDTFYPHVRFDEKWQKVCNALLSAEQNNQRYHSENSLFKEFLNLWRTKPDLYLEDGLRSLAHKYPVFEEISANLLKSSLLEHVAVPSPSLRKKI